MQLGWPLPKRRALIEELFNTTADAKYQLKFQGRMRQFDIFTVPIEMPKYRLANGRTQSAQDTLIAQKGLPEDYFDKDQESEEVHLEQHKILVTKLGDKDLIGVFKKNIQEIPLVLTNLGFVVNGNRRLCAMRQLLEEDKEKYAHFRHIDVIILPPCDEKDIDDFEAQEQIKEDIKADYGWITFACMLRKKHKTQGLSFEELTGRYDISINQLEDLLDDLEHVDTYLNNRNKVKMYHELNSKHKYAFQELRKGRLKIKDDAKREIFTSIAYHFIDIPESTGLGRLYRVIPSIHSHLDKITEKLKLELPIESEQVPPDDIFDLLTDEQNDIDLETLALELDKPEYGDQVIEVVMDVIREEQEGIKNQKSKTATLNNITRANTLLQDALNCFNGQSVTVGMIEQLNSIEDSLQKLRELLMAHA